MAISDRMAKSIPHTLIACLNWKGDLAYVVGLEYEPTASTAMRRYAEAIMSAEGKAGRLAEGPYLITRHADTDIMSSVTVTPFYRSITENEDGGWSPLYARGEDVGQVRHRRMRVHESGAYRRTPRNDDPFGIAGHTSPAGTKMRCIESEYLMNDGRHFTLATVEIHAGMGRGKTLAATTWYEDNTWTEDPRDKLRSNYPYGVGGGLHSSCIFLASGVTRGELGEGNVPDCITVVRPRTTVQYQQIRDRLTSDIWETIGVGHWIEHPTGRLPLRAHLIRSCRAKGVSVRPKPDGTGRHSSRAERTIRRLMNMGVSRFHLLLGDAAHAYFMDERFPIDRADKLARNLREEAGVSLPRAAAVGLYSRIVEYERRLNAAHTKRCDVANYPWQREHDACCAGLASHLNGLEAYRTADGPKLVDLLELNTDPRGPIIQFAFGPQKANSWGGNYIP